MLASDEALGYPLAAPYDAIIVGASAPKVPQSLVSQLKIGARMVIPIGPSRQQRLAIVTRTLDDITTSVTVFRAFSCLDRTGGVVRYGVSIVHADVEVG